MFKFFYWSVGTTALSAALAALFVDGPAAIGTLLLIAVVGVVLLFLLSALNRSSRMSSSQHPEIREGEVFLVNGSEVLFSWMPWPTKRMGSHAYGGSGVLIRGIPAVYPFFVQQEWWDTFRAMGSSDATH